jgi:hypothetical protein
VTVHLVAAGAVLATMAAAVAVILLHPAWSTGAVIVNGAVDVAAIVASTWWLARRSAE